MFYLTLPQTSYAIEGDILCLFLFGLMVISKRLVKVTLKFFNGCLDLSSHTLVADVNRSSIIRNVHKHVSPTR